MVEYLECEHSGVKEYYIDIFKTANTVDLTATGWYQVLFTYFLHKKPVMYVGPLQEKVPRVPGRRFPMVQYPFMLTGNSGRWSRVIIVEVMDLGDPQRSWDVKNSDVYEEIRDMDPAHPERKSFGALSAGTNFVLFEVTGKKDPVYLLGSPESPANFIEDAESLEEKMRYIREVALAKECKCPYTEVTSGAAASVGENATAKSAAPHVAENTSSTSSATASPVASAKTAPAASTSTPIGHTADPKPVIPVTGTKPAATSNSRSSSPVRAGGNGLKATSANK